MSFPRYPAYKDSGVAWLGNVPVHWGVMSLVRDIEFITSGARGWAENYSDDGDLFIRIGNLTRDSIHLDLSDVQRVVVPPSAEVDRTQVRSGDVLFSITAYLGSVAVVPPDLGKAFVSQHVALVRPKQQHCIPAWIGYVAISHVGKTHLETTGYGGTKVQLSLADVTTMPVLVPPKDEQSQLVGFLDRETAKIDALVAEQEQLITLLKEKRQAVISHAVTKGLAPSVPMKDSGVEWLGEVPAHWELVRVKHLVKVFEQGWSPQCENFPVESASDWGVLKVGCVNGGIFNPEENKALPLDLTPLPELGISAGDLLISRANTRELVGSAAVASADHHNLMLCDKLYRLRLDPDLCLPAFLSLFLGTERARGQIELAATGASSSMLNISQSTILEMCLALPPIAEQQDLLQSIEESATQLDQLVKEAVLSIGLLRERRSALISAAVTGQIDVRSLAPAQEQAA